MATSHGIDRRRHHGPFRIMYMDLAMFLHRYLGIGHPRASTHRR